MKNYQSAYPLFDQPKPEPEIKLNSSVPEWDAPRLKEYHKRLLDLLSDREWHGTYELIEVAGNRYGGRLHELKKAGIMWEKRHVANGRWEYRLI